LFGGGAISRQADGEETVMFTHPYISSEVARYRQQEMIAQASQHHLAAQLRAVSRASRPARRAGRKLSRHVLGARAQWRRAVGT
jgi:hypothetical protein